MYELMGRAHAALVQERGQGTVEYVGLILLIGVLIAGVVKAQRRAFSDDGDREGGRRASSRPRSTASAATESGCGVSATCARRRADRGRGRPARSGRPCQTGGVVAPPVPPSAPDALRRRPVGVFDSGVGGLTVLHELLVQLPHEDFVYFADTARVPYGPRPRGEIEAFSLEVAEELLARRIKLLVVACNSASSAALPALRERLMQTTLGVDVLGVVQPGAVHGRGRDPQRPRRLHGDGGDRAPAAPTRRRSRRRTRS